MLNKLIKEFSCVLACMCVCVLACVCVCVCACACVRGRVCVLIYIPISFRSVYSNYLTHIPKLNCTNLDSL